MISFAGQAVAITGAASGIGWATARLLAAYGARLALMDRDADRLAAAVAQLGGAKAGVWGQALDVAQAEQVQAVMTALAAQTQGLDHLVHCAGIYPSSLLRDTRDADWRQLMAVNLDGTFHVSRSALGLLREGGSLVLLSSLAAQRGSHAHAAYAASKGAVQSLMRSLALEAAPRLRVNAVAPGIIATAMTDGLIDAKGAALLAATPLARFGTAEEVAGAIAYLCSPLAGFVTGEVLQVNGGIYMA